MKKRHFVLGIDGMPFLLVQEKIRNGKMKNLKQICEKGRFKAIDSVYPVISSVAWTSYATGVNPASHNIYGFIDRRLEPFSIHIPTAKDRKVKTMWNRMSQDGKKVFFINVPLTYPAEKVNGIMVSCFLCPSLEKATYPQEFYKYLKSKNYILDVDANLVKQDKIQYIKELIKIMKTRFEVCYELMEKEEWDFIQLHIMETDRLFHFLWDEVTDSNDNLYKPLIDEFFECLDFNIGEIYKRLPQNTGYTLLSDHGFCSIKYEVQLNTWLEQEGFLKYENHNERGFLNYSRDSVCYSILPGRIYINLEGREPKGSIKQEHYKEVCCMIKEKLLNMRDPFNNPVINRVFFRDEIYNGLYIKDAPDIIAHPVDGYDLKGQAKGPLVFTRSHLNGMHTFENATIISTSLDIDSIHSITDVCEILIKELCQ